MSTWMCVLRGCIGVTVAVSFLGGRAAFAQQSAQAVTPPVPSEELPAGSQVLTGGPVHEAFAAPVTTETQAPIIVSAQPPANLQETPPAEMPTTAGVVWAPGYWAWDADRNDFIWVSGCWRNPPPGTYWVPGYWQQVTNGWQWIGGFWSPVAQQTIEYLSAPPAPAEADPTVEAPAPDQVWVSGCWYWVQGRYVWRRGYWMTQQAGWVWMPSHYVWTPRGYIFFHGCWDYELDNRGVLFTPTYFPSAVRLRAGFVFCPSVCVDLGVLRLNLFAYPRYHHYFFGDYYDDSYRVVGIYPWFQCQTVHMWYDPLFIHDRWHYRHSEPRWAENRAHEFEQRRSNRDLRPPRTFADMQARASRQPPNSHAERPLVQPLKTYASSPRSPIKFGRINADDRQKISERATESRNQSNNQRVHGGVPSVQPGAGASGTTVRRPATTETRTTPGAVANPGQSVQPGAGASGSTIRRPATTETRTAPGAVANPGQSVQPGAGASGSTIRRPATTETRTAPGVTANPSAQSGAGVSGAAVRRPATTETRSAVEPSVARSTVKSTPEVKRVEVAQPQAVRVTRPEQAVVPTQSKTQSPSDVRSAVKNSTGTPSEDRSRTGDSASGKGSSDRARDSSSNRGR